MENSNSNVSQSKNLKYLILSLIVIVLVVIIAVSSSIFSKLNSSQSTNSKSSQQSQQADSNTSNKVYQNLKPDVLSGDSNTNFYYKGMQIKLVESGVLTPEIESKAPEFCNLSKRCGKINPYQSSQNDKIVYYIGFFITNTTTDITVNKLFEDIIGRYTKLIDMDGNELTKSDDYISNGYCSASPNSTSISRDILPGESRFVNFCFSIPKDSIVKQFVSKVNRAFLSEVDFNDKNQLTIDLKPEYYNGYSDIVFGKPDLVNFGNEKVVAGLKIKILSAKIQDPKELVKVIKQHSSIDNQVAIVMELENTSDKEISVEEAYDFVFNHKIGITEKDYSYAYSDSPDAIYDFKTESKLAPKQKIYMFHYFGVSQKDINLKDYHLSVIYNSASRKGSFEKNNTQWQAFSMSS